MNKRTWIIGAIVILLILGGIYFDHHRANAPTVATTATSTESIATATTIQSATSPQKPATANGTGATAVNDKGENVPVTVVSNQTISITEAQNNKTVTVKKGTRVVLALGEDIWTVSLTPTGILNALQNIGSIPGVQAIYKADIAGKTTIQGEGRPNCKPGDMCAQYIKNFTATIVVQ